MTETIPDRDMAIQSITGLVLAFYAALESQNPQQIQATQQSLSTVAEMVWMQASGDPHLSARDKALVRLLAEGAIRELPVKIQDPANYPQIKRELRLLKSSLLLLA